ncbi:hypothetical protein ACFQVC_22750 [Streptomyces monticola]|uniref:Peptidase M50 n=1 Tax=Streptomyces monticola TaxID=2666263 RepID=A0ABW2JN12_9ACTN
MPTPPLADDARVTLHPLHIGGPEDGLREVGRPETGVFIALPEEGVALIAWLHQGCPLSEVRAHFTESFGVAPELDEFIEGLADCGFVKDIDGLPVGAAPASQPAGGWRLFATLPTRWFGWLLSSPSRVAYRLLWAALPALLIWRPDLLPRPKDTLLVDGVMLNAVIVALLAWAMVFLHELAHLVTARARGAVGALSLSRRMYFLVAQTDMSGVRALPRAERYAPYLAGMTLEAGVLLTCLLLRLADAGGGLPATLAYVVTIQLLFQCALFLRTDLYFVLTNRLRAGNLADDTRQVLRAQWRRATGGPPVDLGAIPARERRLVRWYLPFYAAGVAAALADLVLLIVPALVTMCRRAAAELAGPHLLHQAEAAAFLAIVAFNLGSVTVIALRQRRRQAAAAAAAAAATA